MKFFWAIIKRDLRLSWRQGGGCCGGGGGVFHDCCVFVSLWGWLEGGYFGADCPRNYLGVRFVGLLCCLWNNYFRMIFRMVALIYSYSPICL